MAISSDQKLIERMQAVLRQVAASMPVPLTAKLWDGSEVPLDPGTPSAATVSIASPGVIASLMRRPTLDNLVKHYAVGNIAMDGEMMKTVQAIRSRAKTKDLKKVSKRELVSQLWPFLFVRGQAAVAKHDFKEDAAGAEHTNKNNQDYIQFHYDVSNEFYKLFLDPEMQYSCGYFTDWDQTLEQAQLNKLEMICRKLRLKKGDKLLDIGCGWGGLICYAAKNYGVKAHGITLSQKQFERTQEKIKELGLEKQVTVEIRDYLKLTGKFDKISSIGMFEHIGLANFPTYFLKIRSLLREGGIVLNHGIARRAKADMKASLTHLSPSKKLILKYIFPGSELAPIGHSVNSMEANGFEIHDVENWREHYALTSKFWCERLEANQEKAIAMVGLERYNLWIAYLAGVSFGFASGSILIYQTVATRRAKEKGPSGMPPTRADLYR